MSSAGKDTEKRKYEALNLLVNARTKRNLTQDAVAAHFHVSRRTINAWEGGQSYPDEKTRYLDEKSGEVITRRELMVECLWNLYDLKNDEERFYDIWRNLVVGIWKWTELTEAEKARYDLVFHPQHWIGVPARPQRLPLYGREELLSHVKPRIEPGNFLVLTGMPGSGKTRFAIDLARDGEIIDRFPDGIIWMRMGQQPNFVAEVTKIGEDMGIDVAHLPPEKRWRVVQNAIGTGHYLFIVDDVWATQEVKSHFYTDFDHPNCCVVITTRDELVARSLVAPDQVARVPELDVEGEDTPAYKLLEQLADRTCNSDPQAAQELVRIMGGLPLALVLLGGFLSNPESSFFMDERTRALEELGDPMTRLQLAQQRLGALEDKEMTLQEIISLSIDTLPDHMVPAFYALGVFAPKPASFDREAALQATNAAPNTLTTLTLRNLMEIDAQERFTIHSVLCDVARTATSVESFIRTASYYTMLAKTLSKQGRQGYRQLDSERAHILAVTNGCAVQKQWSAVSGMARAIDDYLEIQGYWIDRVAILEANLAAAVDRHDRYNEGVILYKLGSTYVFQSQHQKSIEYFEQALTIFRQFGDRGGECSCLSGFANVFGAKGRFRKAIDYHLESLNICREIGDQDGEAADLHNLGDMFAATSRY